MSRTARILSLALAVVAALVACGYFWLLYAPHPPVPRYTLIETTLDVDGRPRRYSLYVPPELDSPAPLLMMLHGSTGSAATIRRRSGYRFEHIARRAGAVIAYPEGTDGYWNGCRKAATHPAQLGNVDDVRFLKTLVGDLAASGLVDPARVYAAGYSNGGHMAYRLAVEAPDLVAGIAAFAASFPTENNFDCTAAGVAVKTLIVNGTHDPVNPFDGGEVSLFGFQSLGLVRSSRDSADYFLSLYGNTPDTLHETTHTRIPPATISEWRFRGTPVIALVTIQGGGHTIPQRAYRFPRLLGPTPQTDQIIDYLWCFLDGTRCYAASSVFGGNANGDGSPEDRRLLTAPTDVPVRTQ